MLGKWKWIFAGVLMLFLCFGKTQIVDAATRVHYIGLAGNTDAVLLEADGHFGLIDAGEDWDYPNGSSRPGLTKDQGFEKQVIYYMQRVGVTSKNLDFLIGTHAHSDHIGGADEIVSVFKPKKVYLKKYSDANISNSSRWWDNQYVYNKLVSATKSNQVSLVQSLSEGMQISLGTSMKLKVYNTKIHKNIKDENSNSLVIKLSAYGTTALFTGDVTPDVLRALIKQQNISKVDILKLPHHGYLENNPADILKNISPRYAIVTGPSINLYSGAWDTLKSMKSTVYSTNDDRASVAMNVTQVGYTPKNGKVAKGWLLFQKIWSYHNSNARVTKGWSLIDNCWYWFDQKGRMQTGWLKDGKQTYYLAPKGMKGYKEGQMVSGWTQIGSKIYYMKPGSGEMLTGMQTIGNKIYYFKKNGTVGVSGTMLTGFVTVGQDIFYFKQTGGLKTKGQMLTGWLTTNSGKTFYLAKTGAMRKKGRLLTGWLKIGSYDYYFKKTGKAKGEMLTGWQTNGSYTYYFKQTGSTGVKGRLCTGWLTTSTGKTFYLAKTGDVGKKGRLLTGWVKIGNYYYYFRKSSKAKGEMLTGWNSDDTNTYYFTNTGSTGTKGRLLTGWHVIDGKDFYFRRTGAGGVRGEMFTGWRTIDGNRYYFLETGDYGIRGQRMDEPPQSATPTPKSLPEEEPDVTVTETETPTPAQEMQDVTITPEESTPKPEESTPKPDEVTPETTPETMPESTPEVEIPQEITEGTEESVEEMQEGTIVPHLQ